MRGTQMNRKSDVRYEWYHFASLQEWYEIWVISLCFTTGVIWDMSDITLLHSKSDVRYEWYHFASLQEWYEIRVISLCFTPRSGFKSHTLSSAAFLIKYTVHIAVFINYTVIYGVYIRSTLGMSLHIFLLDVGGTTSYSTPTMTPSRTLVLVSNSSKAWLHIPCVLCKPCS